MNLIDIIAECDVVWSKFKSLMFWNGIIMLIDVWALFCKICTSLKNQNVLFISLTCKNFKIEIFPLAFWQSSIGISTKQSHYQNFKNRFCFKPFKLK